MARLLGGEIREIEKAAGVRRRAGP